MKQLQQEDLRVRVVYKDFPMLGDASEVAAKAAWTSRAQGKHQAFHKALLATTHESRKRNLGITRATSGLMPRGSQPTWPIRNGKPSSIIERNPAFASVHPLRPVVAQSCGP